MKSNEEIDELKAKTLCYICIGEKYLSDEVRSKGRRNQCSYCGRSVRTYSIEDIAGRVEMAFKQHFRRTSDHPASWQLSLLSDRESEHRWERDGTPVVLAIANAAEVPKQVAQDIQTILNGKFYDFDSAAMGEETEFCSKSYYEEKGSDDNTWQEEWRYFEHSLKTEARFFSRNAEKLLASIFRGIDKMLTTHGKPLVIDAGPQTKLASIFRARVFQSDKKLKEAISRPDKYLASPPSIFASAGRMNAHGISVFYGSDDSGVAIAEVRPPVGSQVAVARFDIIRPLRLLDLTALNSVNENGSIFDTGWASRLERATFLRSLSQRITKPVMPNDVAFEYLPTQAIADFLATENEPLLDGISFPSVQAAGERLNVVLFHKAARVESMDIPEGTFIDTNKGRMSEDGWEVDYSVIEHIRPIPLNAEFAIEHDEDPRDVTLRIDINSVTVHIVRNVQFECDPHKVRRERRETSDIDL